MRTPVPGDHFFGQIPGLEVLFTGVFRHQAEHILSQSLDRNRPHTAPPYQRNVPGASGAGRGVILAKETEKNTMRYGRNHKSQRGGRREETAADARK